MSHPICEFCRTPFYTDNDLYSHISTEHYTCHRCQRQHPGQYEYYKNYDDLESIPLAFCCRISIEKLEKAVLMSSERSWHVKVSRGSKWGIYFKERVGLILCSIMA